LLRASRKQSKPDSGIVKTAWKRSRPGLCLIAVFSTFINLCRLATPIFVLQILDRIPASRSIETIVMLSVITLCAITAGILLEVMRRRMFLHWGSWIERQFGPVLIQSGLADDVYGDAMTPSDTVRDLSTIRSFVSGHGLLAWIDVVWAPAFVLVAYLISPLLAGIVVIGILCVLLLGMFGDILTRSSRETAQRASSDSKEWVIAAEHGGETIGPLRMAGNVTQRWSEATFERLDETLRSRQITINVNAAIRFCGRCLRVVLLGVGLWLFIVDDMTLGGVIAAGFLGRMAFQAVRDAMMRWRDLAVAKRAYKRVSGALQTIGNSDVSMLDHTLTAPLAIQDLSYRYPGQSASVLKRINMTLKPGTTLCVVGPSASGKTTFSRLAIGRLRPRQGSIRIGDVDISRLRQDGQHHYVGYLPQDISLFRGTVRENIAHMTKGDFSQVVEAAQLAGAHDPILTLPQGYDTDLVEGQALLSAGQRKAIALARAFYGWPQLIVMDEPEPHLDRNARRTLVRALKTCAEQGSIIVVTSQSKSLTRIADKVLLLEDGKLRLIEAREEIDALRRSRTRRSAKAKS
jgi:PrtD family type I secretion system ABC transporter